MTEIYRVTLVIATEEGDPDEWGWEELIGDTVISVNSTKLLLTEAPKEENEYMASPFIQVQIEEDEV